MKKPLSKKYKSSSFESLKKKQATALLNKANQLLSNNQLDKAREVFDSILRLVPSDGEALTNYAQLCVREREFVKAAELLEKARNTGQISLENLGNLAMVYCYLQQWDRSLEIYEYVLQNNKTNVYALYYTGYAYRGKGEVEKSIPYFQEVIRLQPELTDSYKELCAAFQHLGLKDEIIKLLDQMESDLGRFDKEKRANLLFTLGKYYDEMNEFDRAFRFFEKANNLVSNRRRYDVESDARFMRQIKSSIDHNFVKENSGCGIEDTSPIFIIGMPRSGTSLIEQIVSSHPEIGTGGELLYMYKYAMMFNYTNSCASIKKLAENYLQSTKPYRHVFEYLTDKLPWNYLFAGMIHVALPGAKIFHCTRDPMDTCFSCYKQNFQPGGHYYSFDLETQGHYYRLYMDLMKHWNSILPESIINISYENVINNLETEARGIISDCGLQWNNACRDFYKSQHVVSTASRDQVNRPIYRTSVGRWKNYEQYLEPLKQALDHTQN